MTGIILIPALHHQQRLNDAAILQGSSIQAIVIALFLVLAVSLLVAGLFLGGFIWSVRNDQFDDKQGSAMRILYDSED